MNKRYFWLKLSRDLFYEAPIKLLRGERRGIELLYVYIALMTESVASEGVISFYDEGDIYRELAVRLDIGKRLAQAAFEAFLKYRLIEKIDNTSYAVVYAVSAIGSEGESAERVRKMRERKKAADNAVNNTAAHQNNTSIQSTVTRGTTENTTPTATANNDITHTTNNTANANTTNTTNNTTNKKEEIPQRDPGGFIPPTKEEIAAYALRCGFTHVDCDKFYNNYTAKGWRSCGTLISNWQAQLENWEMADRKRPTAKNIATPTYSGTKPEKHRYASFDPDEMLREAINRSGVSYV